MAHSATDDFFDTPRDWSRYKNIILDYYLKPYLAKVKDLGKPILVIDLFAGRGRFRSGEPGSPLIIAERLKPHVDNGVDAKFICIEHSKNLATDLRKELAHYRFADIWEEDCFKCIDRIERMSINATVFLYVDPFVASQLNLDELAKIYKLTSTQSVEVLEIFMAHSVIRHAKQVLAIEDGPSDVLCDSLIADATPEDKIFWTGALYSRQSTSRLKAVITSRRLLTSVVGGDYWEDIARRANSFEDAVAELVSKYQARLTKWFKLTAAIPIYDSDRGAQPKYWMIFGSRYPPALDLINDAACSARRSEQIAWKNADGLFNDVVVDTSVSIDTVVAEVRHRIRKAGRVVWGGFRWSIEQDQIGRFKKSEIDKAIRILIDKQEVRVCSQSHDNDSLELAWHRASNIST